MLYGRYQNDNYAGGNPWVLSTAALAQLFYRGAQEIQDNGAPSGDALEMWKNAFSLDSDLPTDETELANVFIAAGDSVLQRLYIHVKDDDGHLAEQLDRNDGHQMSAENLTWSYAEVLNAMRVRALVA